MCSIFHRNCLGLILYVGRDRRVKYLSCVFCVQRRTFVITCHHLTSPLLSAVWNRHPSSSSSILCVCLNSLYWATSLRAVIWWEYCQSCSLVAFCSCTVIWAAPPPFRPGNPDLCGSHPLVTPYYCRLGDLLCFVFTCMIIVCFSVICVMYVFLQYFDTVGWVLWPVKNRRPYNLYCVGGDVKPCSINQSTP